MQVRMLHWVSFVRVQILLLLMGSDHLTTADPEIWKGGGQEKLNSLIPTFNGHLFLDLFLQYQEGVIPLGPWARGGLKFLQTETCQLW